MEKKLFKTVEVEILFFEKEDVIRTSALFPDIGDADTNNNTDPNFDK